MNSENEREDTEFWDALKNKEYDKISEREVKGYLFTQTSWSNYNLDQFAGYVTVSSSENVIFRGTCMTKTKHFDSNTPIHGANPSQDPFYVEVTSNNIVTIDLYNGGWVRKYDANTQPEVTVTRGSDHVLVEFDNAQWFGKIQNGSYLKIFTD